MNTNELTDILIFCKQTLKEEFTSIFKDNLYSSHPQYYWMLAHSLLPIFKAENPYHVKVLDLICNVLGDNKYRYTLSEKRSWLTKKIDAWEVDNNIIALNTYIHHSELRIRKCRIGDLTPEKKDNLKLYRLKHLLTFRHNQRTYQVKQLQFKFKNKVITKLYTTGYQYAWSETNTQELSNKYTISGKKPELFSFLASRDPQTLINTILNIDWKKQYGYHPLDGVIDYYNLINKPLSFIHIELLRNMNLGFQESCNLIEHGITITKTKDGFEMPIFE